MELGTRVTIFDPRDDVAVDTGTVVHYQPDGNGNPILPPMIAVEVDNGQGVWGYENDELDEVS